MKERKIYQCEICATVYKERSECEKCEKSHKIKAAIVNARYLGYKQNEKGFPHTVELEFSDGSRAWYKR